MAHLSCGNRPLARCSNQPWCGGILSSPNRDASHPDSPRLVPLAIIFHAAGQETCTQNAEGILARSRAADDFPAIRARMEELKRERAGTRGHHTIRSKSYAKGPFRSPLPLRTVLKEGFERKSLRTFRSTEIHFTNERL